jgi:PAS domain-containing protein
MSAVFTPDASRAPSVAPTPVGLPRTRTTPPNAPWGLCDVMLRADGRWDFVALCPRAAHIVDGELAVWQAEPERFWQRLHPDDHAEARRVATHAALSGDLVKLEFRLVDGGRTKWVRWAALPERDEQGRTVWVGCIIDVTAERPGGVPRGSAE